MLLMSHKKIDQQKYLSYQMFNQNQSQTHKPSTQQRQKLQSYCGVDLSHYDCYKLTPDPIYSNYNKQDIHLAITTMQRGLKPPTKIGIKRNNKRNKQRKLINRRQEENNLASLNSKSPQEICLKALRRQFRDQIAPNTMEDENNSQSNLKIFTKIDKAQKHKNRKPKFIRKKLRQAERRKQLIQLVYDNYEVLQKIFGKTGRLTGFNRKSICPQISRHQIKAALQQYKKQPNYTVSKRSFRRFQRNHSDQYKIQSNDLQSQMIRSSSSSSNDDESSSSYSSSSSSQSHQKSVSNA